ncbi:MAG: 4-hydroxy-tetrahydrodipicolinate synthase [Tsuneonella suprasediminis]|nr:4-hydroxy-tetrahydrodipicolinate synthase [Altererythrobacter sp. N1]
MRPSGDPPLFGGLMTALVTPYRGEAIDFEALGELANWQIDQGAQGLVACGTTGESPTLSHPEWAAVIRLCVEVSNGRVPVIAGSGTNDTRRTVELTREAGRLGADGALVVTPYYSRPNQEGLFRHFESVAQSAELPIIIYNVPSRTAVDIRIETLDRLAYLPGIVGIKDASGDPTRVNTMAVRFGNRFTQLSGHDRSMLAFMMTGGDGAISVVSNIAPMLTAATFGAVRRGDYLEARRINAHLSPLVEALELEANPCPVKFALHCARGYSPAVRLPLVEVSESTAERIRAAMADVNALAIDTSLVAERSLAPSRSGQASPMPTA